MQTGTTTGEMEVMVDWVHGLAPWEVISHLTFSWEAGLDSTRRCFEKFMRQRTPDVSYFYAIEENPSRDGHHVHALWADCAGVLRKGIWRQWFERYGRARIEPVNSREDVAGYCAKYVTKERSWWNVKLVSPELWQRATVRAGAAVPPEPRATRGGGEPLVPFPKCTSTGVHC